MAKKNTSIQINGKRYDALSGALLNFEVSESATSAPIKSIDGVIGAQHTAIKVAKPVTKKPASMTVTKQRTPAHHAKIVRTNPSVTLMRHAVKKPATSLKRSAKTQTSTQLAHTNRTVVIPKTSLNGVNHLRASRAALITTHPRISRFAKEVAIVSEALKTDVQKTVTAIDDAVVIPQTFTPSGNYRPDVRRVRVNVAQGQAASDIFEQALLRATSHEEVAPDMPKGSRLRSLRRRMMSFSAGAVAVLALVGFFGYQKQDALQFRVAANRAGFSATMPGYQPLGYSVSNIKNSNGTLYMQYANAERNYTISQKPTVWGSQTLLERIANNEGANTYTSVDTNGRTVYLYGRNQAAWVHNGVLYQVLGNGALSSTDFTQIASSM